MAYKTMTPNGRSITTPMGFGVTIGQPSLPIMALIGLVGLPIAVSFAVITLLNANGNNNRQLLRR